MTVATWNVNSIKARHDRVISWLEKVSPDVVCLQELKIVEEVFPVDQLAEMGYHAAVFGQKTWNGVAILSRFEIADVRKGMADDVDDPQSRVIACKTADMDVICVYVPNGKAVGSESWDYKMDWMTRLASYLEREFDPDGEVLLCGDINIAPEDVDAAYPDRWRDSVLCDPDGRAKLETILDWGLIDLIREQHEGPGPYSWWDYRRLAFPKGDGLRIDHVFGTEIMAERCEETFVDREERKGAKPSDHAPVVAVFQ
ncbi:MAG: exodeoxyribonuclease III [Rhodothermales bacterium]|nr:exodeoxyribonuclease III [Rhodothermales bacterium]